MWKSLSEWLRRVSTGWVALIALVIFLSFSALVLPSQSANAEIDSQGVGSPDLSFYYSPDELYSMAEAYGEAGRDAYVRARFTFDVVWPIVYTLFLSTALSWLYTRLFSAGSFWQRANLAPVFTMVKWALVTGSFVLLLVGVFAGVWRWIRVRREA
jgi:hypothetical protein